MFYGLYRERRMLRQLSSLLLHLLRDPELPLAIQTRRLHPCREEGGGPGFPDPVWSFRSQERLAIRPLRPPPPVVLRSPHRAYGLVCRFSFSAYGVQLVCGILRLPRRTVSSVSLL